jgi:hypothetical protein
MFCPSYPPWLDHFNYTWNKVTLIKIITKQSQQSQMNTATKISHMPNWKTIGEYRLVYDRWFRIGPKNMYNGIYVTVSQCSSMETFVYVQPVSRLSTLCTWMEPWSVIWGP